MKTKLALIGKGMIRQMNSKLYQRRRANKIPTPKFTHSEKDRSRQYSEQRQIKG